jgi:FkbM family methyltransferase
MEIKNFEELYNFVSSNSPDDIIKASDSNYNYELFYRRFAKARLDNLKRDKKIIDYVWQKYLTRSKTFGLILTKLFSYKAPDGYFGGRPLECVFKNLVPAPYGGVGGTTPTFYDAIKEIKDNIGDYKSVYENFDDALSKKTLFTVLLARITRDPSLFISQGIYVSGFSACFDQSMVKLGGQSVFVDCGGFDGDTVKEFIKVFKKYKRIYVFEPDVLIIDKLKRNLGKYKNIVIKNAAVSDKAENGVFLSDGAGCGRLTGDSGQSADGISTVTLDDSVGEPVSFVKMDIEGAELSALKGLKNHLIADSPILAINVYHKLGDIRECLNYIKSVNPKYKFYLRHYCHIYIKTVLYAKIVN